MQLVVLLLQVEIVLVVENINHTMLIMLSQICRPLLYAVRRLVRWILQILVFWIVFLQNVINVQFMVPIAIHDARNVLVAVEEAEAAFRCTDVTLVECNVHALAVFFAEVQR